MSTAGKPAAEAGTIRCAIYTRKSTEEGLEQEFNSLMAQREAAESYIRSQRELGWAAVADNYSDGGFSGGNMERPGLKRLLADVEAQRIDCVVVYKVDRLSRSLLDFAAIIGLLDKYGVTFVSVTQQFNTNTSLGRLTLNILLSFAQFERELTRERTRDKVFAARRKGKWTGGHPVLGYDLDIRGGKLHVNEKEAEQVREIFETFARTRSLVQTLYEIERRGWKAKSWITRKEKKYGGQTLTRHTLEYMLTNPIYIGRVRLKGELHAGEQEAIIDQGLWRKVNTILKAAERGPSLRKQEPQSAPLRGLLFCAGCASPMVPGYTKRNQARVRYYTCASAQKHGWKTCTSRTISAEAIEQAVLERLRCESNAKNADLATLPQFIERISFDGKTSQVVITRRATGEGESGQSPISFQITLNKLPPRHTRVTRHQGRMPRISRLMALAIRFEELLKNGTAADYADLSRLGKVSRARMTQIMNLLNLAPDIQESLLFLPPVRSWRDAISERTCRPVVEEPCWKRQRHIFGQLLAKTGQ